ncbi:REP-associated tyrosine transposase [Fulvivirga lutimaris]|uniref:REP-associated tyrosine transposase n=1 Tax=Fulvivirga lutimaris TaxID=1819566 RepID=UPI001C8746BA
MSGDRYKIQDQQACYFITMTVVYWIDVFSRRDYKDVIVESLNYCIANKGLNLYAWVIMSNHIHIVGKVDTELGMSGFLRDFKKFTSKKIVELIQEIPESRRDWLLDKFSFEARRTGRAENYKLWKDDNHAIDMSTIDMMNKIDYIHDNPVRAGLVHEPDQYVYSSATDYAGGKGMVNVTVV